MKLIPALALALVSCGSSPKPEMDSPEDLTPPEQKIVGRIASVSKVGKFVLIQKYGPGTLPPNLIYQARGPGGRSASLRPSGERIRDFFAADLISGTVKNGDAVVTYPLPQNDKPNEDPQSDPIETIDPPNPAPPSKNKPEDH